MAFCRISRPKPYLVSKTKNAIKLLDFIGYPKEIIKKSFERAEKVDGFI